MKKLAIIAFTTRGAQLASLLATALPAQGYAFGRYATANLTRVDDRLGWCEARWHDCDGILFIGATGIAVRTIAPFLQDKTTDPAILVMDEGANYIISLLSGHIGGANALAWELAELTGAAPVITTATDVNGLFAVDVFAQENQLEIASMPLAKAISAAILRREQVGLQCDFPIDGTVPHGLTLCGEQALNIAICTQNPNRTDTLWLRPKPYVLGIGCKRNTSQEQIAQTVAKVAKNVDISCVASIDLKANEAGLLAWCQQNRLKFVTYTAQALRAVDGEFSHSTFVEQTTGVDCVCERAAALASQGQIVTPKTAENGITLSLAARKVRIKF